MKSNSHSGIANISSVCFFPTLFRRLSTILFVCALAAMLTLLMSDAFSALTLTALHRYAGALSFMLIGSSYVALQISLRRPRSEKVKAILLGMAFLFWGSGQFLPPGLFATAMDSAVVVIFVVDLSLIIIEHLKRGHYE
jgi:peptidoglycan/LPS O-acetylase OafA/YrhL